MAGATGSGQAMETGRTNRAEGRTILWAQVPPDEPNFNGSAILIVEVAKQAEDPDDYEGSTFRPTTQLDGIVASGHSDQRTKELGGMPGGVGVIGRGGNNQGTGVLGLGSAGIFTGPAGTSSFVGEGGIGVHGVGGEKSPLFSRPDAVPGAGVVGQGGRQAAGANLLRLPHAAGVIGISGGLGSDVDLLPLHSLAETGGVGVYGQGSDALLVAVTPPDPSGVPGPSVPSGPLEPGAGVLGRGGVPFPPEGSVAAGVIGLAGGVAIPKLAETGNTGVYGAGTIGVFGHGSTGVLGQTEAAVGVHGAAMGSTGRGALFESLRSAQLQLSPQPLRESFAAPVSVTAKEIVTNDEGVRLPRDGRAGDLLSLIDQAGQCALWFCVRSAEADPAQWAQVLLGTAFQGRG